MPVRLWVHVIAVLFTLMSASSGWGSRNCDEWVARGDGVLVTPQDVDDLASYYMAQNIMADRENFVQTAIKYKLYNYEADRLELMDDGVFAASVAGVEGVIRQAERYLRWALEQQEVTELVIESYFRSFPERFVDAEGMPRETLDDDVRAEIRQRVLGARKDRIDQQAYADLKERYGVQVCNGRAVGSGT